MKRLILILAAPLLLANMVSESDLRQHIEVLASDAYEGRAPGTPGGDRTAHYIASALHKAGLVSGTAGPLGWYQPVPLVERTPRVSQTSFVANGRPVKIDDRQIALRSRERTASVSAAPLFFAGHATDADNLDVAGKFVLMLFEPRPGVVGGPSSRDRREALARKGAAAVVMIAGKETPYETLRSGIAQRSSVLASNAPAAAIDGVMAPEAATALFAAAGLDFGKAVSAAAAEGYGGAALAITADAQVETTIRDYDSYNVVARLPGSGGAGAGAILVTGHWDHLGICRDEGAADRICNGAVDNASGIAMMIEAAKRLADGPQLARDVYFIATTAEEMGLLGAYHFVAEPPIPLDAMQAVLNVDTIAIAPKGTPVAIINKGNTRIDPLVEQAAAGLGLKIDPDDEAKAFIRRQDGWAFGSKDVPFVMAGTGFSDMEQLQKFLGGPYHKPEDDLSRPIELGGAADDANLHIALIRLLADPRHYNR